MSNRAYKNGDYLVECDRTGFIVHRSECKYEWNGLLVRKDVWEPRQTQDLIKLKADKQAVPDARSISEDVFLTQADPVTADDL